MRGIMDEMSPPSPSPPGVDRSRISATSLSGSSFGRWRTACRAGAATLFYEPRIYPRSCHGRLAASSRLVTVWPVYRSRPTMTR